MLARAQARDPQMEFTRKFWVRRRTFFLGAEPTPADPQLDQRRTLAQDMRQSTLRQQRTTPEGKFRQTLGVAEDLHQVHVGDAVEGNNPRISLAKRPRTARQRADLLDVDEDDF